MDEQTRLKHCEEIAERMYFAGMGWQYDVIERFTRPQIDAKRLLQLVNKQSIMRRKINRCFLHRS